MERLQVLQSNLIILEATGVYQQAVVEALAAVELPVAVVNPRQARDFANATGQLAKTDVLDARALAHFAEAVRPTPSPCPGAQTDNSAPFWHGGGNWSACERPDRIALGLHPHGCRQTSRLLSPGSTPGW